MNHYNSWLFFPFHRWYLYFYERILGKLINDPTFALPFWKWDFPEGMEIPEMFIPKYTSGILNPLYDVYRDATHVDKKLVDLDYDKDEKKLSNQEQIKCNLRTVYRDMIRNGADTQSFFGGKYSAGNEPGKNEDMGNFYSAGYDPLFYVHHSNVDRMWKLWKGLGLPGHVEPNEEDDWLNASYVFYDENEELVRVYNKDCVNLGKLKYNYIEDPDRDLPWLKVRPAKRSKRLQVASTEEVQRVEQLKFPVSLDKIVKVRVQRPPINNLKMLLDNEVLLLANIRFGCDKFVKFEVYVNDNLKDSVLATPCGAEYVGAFAQIPHFDKAIRSYGARFGLKEVLEDTNSEREGFVTVTLVPKVGCEDLTIGEITIKFVSRRLA
ncbi:hypothetical protein QVD17_05516 [Tagetes erecta]|uniref:Tyrosinase copper-binding domain-containing protein n=1 Tax=Tagetes erecta TaxID=13708 RepID=A0AAD8PBL1_TARER|nr:hypothetical protein QVD17_05516 [Tagetes erecta]